MQDDPRIVRISGVSGCNEKEESKLRSESSSATAAEVSLGRRHRFGEAPESERVKATGEFGPRQSEKREGKISN